MLVFLRLLHRFRLYLLAGATVDQSILEFDLLELRLRAGLYAVRATLFHSLVLDSDLKVVTVVQHRLVQRRILAALPTFLTMRRRLFHLTRHLRVVYVLQVAVFCR